MEAIQKKIENYMKESIMLYASKVSEKYEENGSMSYKELLEIAEEMFKNGTTKETGKKNTKTTEKAADLKKRCIELGIKPMRKKEDMIAAIKNAELNKDKKQEEEQYESETESETENK